MIIHKLLKPDSLDIEASFFLKFSLFIGLALAIGLDLNMELTTWNNHSPIGFFLNFFNLAIFFFLI